MKLRSIEPTPNPNSMKLNLDESLPQGVSITYRPETRAHYPENIRRLLEIPGVKNIFHCLDFLTIQRMPSAEWETLLSLARTALGSETEARPLQIPEEAEPLGLVKIFVQYFRRIPMLVKAQAGNEEFRATLPERFPAAVRNATPSSPNMLLERRWIPVEPHYGELREVGEAVAAEIDASYPESRLDALVKQAFELGKEGVEPRRVVPPEELKGMLASLDWKQRYTAVETMGTEPGHFPELAAAMKDSNISVRRLATIHVGLLKSPATFAPLCEAVGDTAVVVRRTACDALNDLGDPKAGPVMIGALKDSNKLVRWRAARFLYELGDATALPALRAALQDPEFEVRLQTAQAIERIKGGKQAAGPIWMQMTKKISPE